jgi:hypothetical protein
MAFTYFKTVTHGTTIRFIDMRPDLPDDFAYTPFWTEDAAGHLVDDVHDAVGMGASIRIIANDADADEYMRTHGHSIRYHYTSGGKTHEHVPLTIASPASLKV